MKVLILGERGDEHPWSNGPSSKRLWRWFGVESHAEFAEFVTLMNVYSNKDSSETIEVRYARLRDLIVEHDVVFLVGKVAQRQVFRDHPTLRLIFWRQNKYVGLPHPSGRNRQLNGVKDRDIHEFIIDVMQRYLRGTQAIINRVLEGRHDP